MSRNEPIVWPLVILCAGTASMGAVIGWIGTTIIRERGKETVSTTEQESGFWALIELFGHQQIAGFVSSQTIGGETFIRVDVPETPKQKQWSKLFGKGAIYAITPMAEDIVKRKASSLEVAPLTAWDLPEDLRAKIKQQALPSPPSPPSHELYEFEDDYGVREDGFDDFDDDD